MLRKKIQGTRKYEVAYPLRYRVALSIEAPSFQRFILMLIMFNAALVSYATLGNISVGLQKTYLLLGQCFAATFMLELLFRLYAHRLRFFHDPWNIFDAIVICAAAYPPLTLFAILRIIRLMRALNIVPSTPGAGIIADVLRKSSGSLFAIVLVLFVVSFTYALFGYHSFYNEFPEYYLNFGEAFKITLFVMFEGWPSEIVGDLTRYYDNAIYYFWSLWLIARGLMISAILIFIATTIEIVSTNNRTSIVRALEYSDRS